jgi:hypothetical protein
MFDCRYKLEQVRTRWKKLVQDERSKREEKEVLDMIYASRPSRRLYLLPDDYKFKQKLQV